LRLNFEREVASKAGATIIKQSAHYHPAKIASAKVGLPG